MLSNNKYNNYQRIHKKWCNNFFREWIFWCYFPNIFETCLKHARILFDHSGEIHCSISFSATVRERRLRSVGRWERKARYYYHDELLGISDERVVAASKQSFCKCSYSSFIVGWKFQINLNSWVPKFTGKLFVLLTHWDNTCMVSL